MDQVLPFKVGWLLMGDLPGYRESGPGRTPASYENLPPLDETRFTGAFQWLYEAQAVRAPTPAGERAPHAARESPPSRFTEHLTALLTSAGQVGLTLPEPFLHFLASPLLQEAIFACSDCWISPPDTVVPCPRDRDGFIIRFLTDQEDCLFWYLYLRPSTQAYCVLASWYALDPDEAGNYMDGDPEEEESIANAIVVCALSFEAFLYRFWLENVLGFKLAWAPSDPLTSEEQRYLAHYRLHPESQSARND